MNTSSQPRQRQAHKAIEPSWVTLGQACALIMMVIRHLPRFIFNKMDI